MLVKYLSLLIGLMVVLAFGVRPALGERLWRRQSKVRLTSFRGVRAAGHSALPQPEAALPDPERVRAQEIFEQVTRQ